MRTVSVFNLAFYPSKFPVDCLHKKVLNDVLLLEMFIFNILFITVNMPSAPSICLPGGVTKF